MVLVASLLWRPSFTLLEIDLSSLCSDKIKRRDNADVKENERKHMMRGGHLL
jgi:hypothetical protein